MKGDREIEAEIFAELQKRQLNKGPCAAVIVDCDCDWCLQHEAKRMARIRKEGNQ